MFETHNSVYAPVFRIMKSRRVSFFIHIDRLIWGGPFGHGLPLRIPALLSAVCMKVILLTLGGMIEH